MNKHTILLCLAGALTAAGLQSCHKENSGGPMVKGIRADQPSPNDTTLSYVNPGQYVILDGAGLSSTVQVTFDGVAATYNSALAADQTLVIAVPSIPFTSLDTTKANTIVVTTTHGSFTYHFPVVPPPPAVAALSNEFAHPGDVITLTGQYLYLVKSVTFPGGIAATQYTTTADGSSMTVTVPPGATTGGGIVITSAGGAGSTEPQAGFNDPAGMVCDFDGVNSYSWGASGIVDSPSFTGNNGYFAQMSFTGVNAGDESWWNGGRSINLNSVQWVSSDHIGDPIGNYALKFEIYVKVPWTVGNFYIVPNGNWTWLAAYAGPGNTTINTNQWQTVVIPLTNFQTNNGAGTAPSSLSTFLGSGSQPIDIMYVNTGTTPMATFDAGVDNIRVVKVK
jgi:hypothetical protein